MEDALYRRLHILHQSDGQPVPAIPVCLCLLADAGPARRNPKRSSFAVAQFDTLRLCLIKIAARVVEIKTQNRLHLPTSCPHQRILRSCSTASCGS
ncbi:transposase [Mesorhizobium sp. M1076]|uniref:transposase n=1 Tax=Mesorhizobium sp. M1076 TaxID=2957054 RepID=UPI00333886DB